MNLTHGFRRGGAPPQIALMPPAGACGPGVSRRLAGGIRRQLDFTAITDEGLRHLEGLTELRLLRFLRGRIGRGARERLEVAITGLTIDREE